MLAVAVAVAVLGGGRGRTGALEGVLVRLREVAGRVCSPSMVVVDVVARARARRRLLSWRRRELFWWRRRREGLRGGMGGAGRGFVGGGWSGCGKGCGWLVMVLVMVFERIGKWSWFGWRRVEVLLLLLLWWALLCVRDGRWCCWG